MARSFLSRGAGLTALGMLLWPAAMAPAGAQSSFGQSVQEQQIYDNSPNRPRGVLDATNPIDLMNRLRRSTAMDNATNPGDAVDQALRDLEKQSSPGPGSPGSAGVKGP
jgi:hypothetical protein